MEGDSGRLRGVVLGEELQSKGRIAIWEISSRGGIQLP